jgi:hypothetical protein
MSEHSFVVKLFLDQFATLAVFCQLDLEVDDGVDLSLYHE